MTADMRLLRSQGCSHAEIAAHLGVPEADVARALCESMADDDGAAEYAAASVRIAGLVPNAGALRKLYGEGE